MKEFIEAYEKRFGEKPNYHAGNAYGALQVTEAALKKAGSFDNEKLRDALATIEVHSVFGRYKVDAKGMNSHEGLTFQILRGPAQGRVAREVGGDEGRAADAGVEQAIGGGVDQPVEAAVGRLPEAPGSRPRCERAASGSRSGWSGAMSAASTCWPPS